jgi:plasmid maintenance system antidote protein VapI
MSKSSITTKDDAMIIRREELDAGRVDLKDVATGKRIPLAHPGEILREDFLEPPRSRVNDIVRGRRAVTADTALRLARYFGTTPEFWINLQAHHDLEIVRQTSRRRIEKEVEPRAA